MRDSACERGRSATEAAAAIGATYGGLLLWTTTSSRARCSRSSVVGHRRGHANDKRREPVASPRGAAWKQRGSAGPQRLQLARDEGVGNLSFPGEWRQVATGRNASRVDGKEGVAGSSPAEGSSGTCRKRRVSSLERRFATGPDGPVWKRLEAGGGERPAAIRCGLPRPRGCGRRSCAPARRPGRKRRVWTSRDDRKDATITMSTRPRRARRRRPSRARSAPSHRFHEAMMAQPASGPLRVALRIGPTLSTAARVNARGLLAIREIDVGSSGDPPSGGRGANDSALQRRACRPAATLKRERADLRAQLPHAGGAGAELVHP
jgi:hypothetical protein